MIKLFKKTAKAKDKGRAKVAPQPIPVWWSAWVGLFLIAFGLPLTAARFAEMPSDSVRLAVLEGKTVSDEALFVHDPMKRFAAGILRSGQVYNDLALIALEAAERPTFSSLREELYLEAEHWQRKALVASPADPYGWFRLAHLLQDKPRGAAAAGQAWALSYAAAPYEPRLILPRLEMALSLGAALDEASRGQIDRLIAQAWAYDPTALAKSAKAGSYITLVEGVFRDDPTRLKHFHDQLDLL